MQSSDQEMHPTSRVRSTFTLSRLGLNIRFGVLLGGIAAITLILFSVFAFYSFDSAQEQFERQATLFARMLAVQAPFDMIMEDTEGLTDKLSMLVESGAVDGGIFRNPAGSELASRTFPDSYRGIVLESRDVSSAWVHSHNGERVLLTSSPIVNETSGTYLGNVVLAMPATALEAQKSTGITIAVAISLVLTMLAGVIMMIVWTTVIRPVDTLRRAAGDVAAGDLSVRVKIRGHDEVAELSRSFNAMVQASQNNHENVEAESQRAAEALEQTGKLQAEADEERRYLRQKFDEIAEVINAVMHGDLTKRLDPQRDDDVGNLMEQINVMIHDLSLLIGQVHKAGNRLSDAARRVALSAEEMSAGAREQANQTSEVAAAVEEMSATIAESSRNAHEANETARQASDVAQKGETSFRETTDGMRRIADIVRESTQKVTALGDSSAHIGEIIRVIGDIADQTNLLALNAAIEAARAGEQGRGFAVVADEVRKLAERTTAATKEISDMITRIQRNTAEVVESMERGDSEVGHGLQIADEAAKALTDIIRSIDGMVDMIDQIAAGSEQQSVTSTQIARNVESISTVSDEVSHATSDLARTSEQMSTQAIEMGRLIERFRVETAEDDTAVPDSRYTAHPN